MLTPSSLWSSLCEGSTCPTSGKRDKYTAKKYFVGMETVSAVAQILGWLTAAAAAVAAVWQYRHTDEHRVADTVIKLEERFRQFGPILRKVDPASGDGDDLIAALQTSLKGYAKTADQSRLIVQFDELLRFFLLLSYLHHNTFLGRELKKMYAYWLSAIYRDVTMRQYVESYFPSVSPFITAGATMDLPRPPSRDVNVQRASNGEPRQHEPPPRPPVSA